MTRNNLMASWTASLRLGIALLPAALPPVASAEVGAPLATEISDAELEQRLAFIEARLNSQQRSVKYWRNGWTGFYSLSSSGQAVAALAANDTDGQVYWGVGAVKAAGGLAQILLKPPSALNSGASFRALPAQSREQRLAKLQQGEALLKTNADETGQRYTWRRRAVGTIGNLVGGVVIAAFGETGAAVLSTLLGLGVHEATIWTQPADAARDLKDYRNGRWAGQAARSNRWRVVASPGGATLHIRF